jgi:hypothetical protein
MIPSTTLLLKNCVRVCRNAGHGMQEACTSLAMHEKEAALRSVAFHRSHQLGTEKHGVFVVFIEDDHTFKKRKTCSRAAF